VAIKPRRAAQRVLAQGLDPVLADDLWRVVEPLRARGN